MGKLVHRMISQDVATGTGVCAKCGPVGLDWRLSRGAREARCRNARLEQRDSPNRFTNRYSAERGKHGLTPTERQARLNGAFCEICGATATAIDHCHRRQELRGTLCHPCNSGLGMFKDDPDRLRNAAAYLDRYA